MSDVIMPAAFKMVTRKARKPHFCCECGSDIRKGEKYQYISGIWDGEPNSYKTCNSCSELRDDYYSSTDDHSAFGFLKEEISNYFYKGYGAKEFAIDYPCVGANIIKLFGVSKNEHHNQKH